jgi:hypothetical protein
LTATVRLARMLAPELLTCRLALGFTSLMPTLAALYFSVTCLMSAPDSF